jgi:serine/threonine protein kinase
MDRVPPTERLDLGGGDAETILGGRYELRSVLGRGGMSEVYAAWDTTLHREVAVKLLHANAATDEGRQRTEARLLASLNHPNLVWVYDAHLEGPHPFFVMELVPGPNLAQWLHDHGTLSPAVATRFGVQLAGALAHIHGRGLVHRDVKPANILLASDRDAKLADFGIARFTGATRVTATGAVLGTAAYLSPEQVQGGSVGPGSDVYSLGLVLLECLTGQVAYPGAVVESAVARLHRRPAVPAGFGALGELLESMTAPDPQDRPTAIAVAEGLGASPSLPHSAAPRQSSASPLNATRVLPAQTATQTVPQRQLPRVQRVQPRRMVTLAAATFLVVVAVVGVTALINGTSSPVKYPSVTGQLGRDLHRLQQAVKP